MTKERLAAILDGREYTNEITASEVTAAEEAGLIVIYGASDDLCELEGAVRDEVGMIDGGTFLLDAEGPIPSERDRDWTDEETERYFARKRAPGKITITGEWSPKDEEIFWRFSASVPSAPFLIMEGEEKFCRGIVIDSPK